MYNRNTFYNYTYDNIHPGFSVDCVILSFYRKKLKVLLNKLEYGKYWQLPGGFMFKNESSDEAAGRVLRERTGLTCAYLRQFHLFSDPGRTRLDQNREYLERDVNIKRKEEFERWFLQRFITLGYFAFVRYEDVKLSSIKEDVSKWFNIDKLPELYADHESIIKTTIGTIRSMLPVLPVGYELLPEKFTMSELRKVYESVTAKTFDRRNFQRKVLSSGIVKPLNEVKGKSKYNPAILYAFDKDKKDTADYFPF
jgi:hypothetical protein